MTDVKRKKQKTSAARKCLTALGIVLVLAAGLGVAYLLNQVQQVHVEGNSFYTAEEIRSMMIGSELENNCWYLYWKYKYSEPPQFPFIDKIEVELADRGELNVHVYEKNIVGYVEYLGNCMYFDKDGVVVESSAREMKQVPKISGLRFDSISLQEKLPVGNDNVFSYILNLTKELKKNEITPDKIQFNDALEATLYFGQARVTLGGEENQSEKIARLKAIAPELEGRSGVLCMEEVNENNKNIIFKIDGN